MYLTTWLLLKVITSCHRSLLLLEFSKFRSLNSRIIALPIPSSPPILSCSALADQAASMLRPVLGGEVRRPATRSRWCLCYDRRPQTPPWDPRGLWHRRWGTLASDEKTSVYSYMRAWNPLIALVAHLRNRRRNGFECRCVIWFCLRPHPCRFWNISPRRQGYEGGQDYMTAVITNITSPHR
jgi:hypothetical protein